MKKLILGALAVAMLMFFAGNLYAQEEGPIPPEPEIPIPETDTRDNVTTTARDRDTIRNATNTRNSWECFSKKRRHIYLLV
jgi:hypothetical protein